MAGPSSGGFGRLNHTIEKTVARKVTDASDVGVKSNIVSAFGDREDFLCLTGPLMGDPTLT